MRKATSGPQGREAAIILRATAIPPPQEHSGVETAILVVTTIEALRYFRIQRFTRSALTYRLIPDEMKTLKSKYGQMTRNVSHTSARDCMNNTRGSFISVTLT